MSAIIVKVTKVEKHPNADRLTLNHLSNGKVCISNLNETGEPRYKEGDLVAHVSIGTIVPEWLLKHNDLWNNDTNKGILGGDNGNEVNIFKLRGIESEGMLVAGEQGLLDSPNHCGGFNNDLRSGPFLSIITSQGWKMARFEGDDVSEILGIS